MQGAKQKREKEECTIETWLVILIAAAAFTVGAVVFFILGGLHRKKIAEAAIGSAEKEANKIVSDAIAAAEAKKKETILEAKDEIHKQRTETERELRERRNEVQRMERRINQKEETLDKKSDNLEKKEETLNKKLKSADEKLEEIESLKKSEFDMLERISGFTQEQAKAYIINLLEENLDHEKAVKIQEYEQKTKDEAEQIAREIITTAIQRCAADHAAEATVSVVALPNDEMKGRIIGREGRNVRTLEMITGVDLIIDDTPEAITISSFDPVRREIARVTLEKLIADGRIHPARIEEMYDKAKREVEAPLSRRARGRLLTQASTTSTPRSSSSSASSNTARATVRTCSIILSRSLTSQASWLRNLAPTSGLQREPACFTISARRLTTRWRAPMSISALNSLRDIRRMTISCTLSRRITATWRLRPSPQCSSRRRTPFRRQDPVQDVRMFRTISSVSRSSRRSPLRLTALSAPMPFRRAERSA